MSIYKTHAFRRGDSCAQKNEKCLPNEKVKWKKKKHNKTRKKLLMLNCGNCTRALRTNVSLGAFRFFLNLPEQNGDDIQNPWKQEFRKTCKTSKREYRYS